MPEIITGNELLRLFLSLKMDLMWTGYIMRSSDYDQLGGLPAYPGLLFADFELLLRLASISYLAVAKSESFSFRVHQSATSTAKDSMMQSAVERFVNFLAVKQNENQELNKIIKENSFIFLDRYTVSYSHRLLRTPLELRNGLRVQDLIEKSKEYAIKLGVNDQHQPENIWLLRIANLIDKSTLLRSLFLLFKQIWKKPVLH